MPDAKYLPPDAAKKWSELKKKLPKAILNSPGYSDDFRPKLNKQVKDTFKMFDKGLSPLITKVEKEDDPEKAKKLLLEIKDVLKDYEWKANQMKKMTSDTYKKVEKLETANGTIDLDVWETEINVTFDLVIKTIGVLKKYTKASLADLP